VPLSGRDAKLPRLSSPRLAFVLNLDAEHELEAGARWTTPRALGARLDEIAAGMRLPEGAVLLTPGMKVPEGTEGRVWCPTPRALARLREAGATVPDVAPVDVVRRVNERTFATELAAGELEPTLLARSIAEVEVLVAQPGPTGRWRLKRGLGASGRGQRSVAAGALSAEDRGWLARSLRGGAVHVEPEVRIEREVAVYGWAHRDGRVTLTGLRGQTTDSRGGFLRCGRMGVEDLGVIHARAFLETAERVGEALVRAGYHGPFGTDGYLHRDPGGALRVRALSEINARYCMGWDERDGF
jgi:hypothetical protein